MSLPEHVCALLTDSAGRLVLQLRPPWIRHAANQLTCFGGKREAHESVSACLARELLEETGWCPTHIAEAGIDLRQGERFIARFIALRLPPGIALRPEPGFIVVITDRRGLPSLPVSPWHQMVIAAWDAGQTQVHLAAE